MQYSFCDLIIEIENNPCVLSNVYNDFRTVKQEVADIVFKCVVDEELEIPKEEPIFECMPGVKVFSRENAEIEHYYHMPNRLLCKLAREGNNLVLRYRQGKTGFFSEMDLINSLLLENIMAKEGRFLLHSSCIKTKYGAVLFTAPSGTGKSTQADLWKKYRGAEILNGDRTCVWKNGDMWMAGGPLWCGTSGIMKNDSLEIAAIVVLRQAPENTVNQLHIMKRIARMMEQTTINDWDRVMYNDAQEFWIEFCSNVPVIELACTPDERAVQVLEEELDKYE